jgi:hypothetical protein
MLGAAACAVGKSTVNLTGEVVWGWGGGAEKLGRGAFLGGGWLEVMTAAEEGSTTEKVGPESLAEVVTRAAPAASLAAAAAVVTAAGKVETSAAAAGGAAAGLAAADFAAAAAAVAAKPAVNGSTGLSRGRGFLSAGRGGAGTAAAAVTPGRE